MTKTYHKDKTLPIDGEIFVFGSNTAGIHGAGAAFVAQRQFGARAGKGIGYSTKGGCKHSYAIPTKGNRLEVLSIDDIRKYVDDFKMFLTYNPNVKCFVSRVGCGLAGYMDHEIAPLFAGCGDNVIFSEEWAPFVAGSEFSL